MGKVLVQKLSVRKKHKGPLIQPPTSYYQQKNLTPEEFNASLGEYKESSMESFDGSEHRAHFADEPQVSSSKKKPPPNKLTKGSRQYSRSLEDFTQPMRGSIDSDKLVAPSPTKPPAFLLRSADPRVSFSDHPSSSSAPIEINSHSRSPPASPSFFSSSPPFGEGKLKNLTNEQLKKITQQARIPPNKKEATVFRNPLLEGQLFHSADDFRGKRKRAHTASALPIPTSRLSPKDTSEEDRRMEEKPQIGKARAETMFNGKK
jgi:hypothetical protein